MKDDLAIDLAPFLDGRGRPEEAYRGAIRRIETRFQRRERRAERDYVDWVLLASRSPPRFGRGRGRRTRVLLNPDLVGEQAGARHRSSARRGMAAVEEARAALAEDINLNTRLVLERRSSASATLRRRAIQGTTTVVLAPLASPAAVGRLRWRA